MEEKQVKKWYKDSKFWKKYFPIIAAILYFISPIDILPEFLAPIIGPFIMTDDIIVLASSIIFSILKNSREKE